MKQREIILRTDDAIPDFSLWRGLFAVAADPGKTRRILFFSKSSNFEKE